MKYKLSWWEENGYHDSYFYGVYFDTEDGKLYAVGLGATAYAGGIGFDETYALPTAEVVELARKELAKRIFCVLRAAEDRDVLTPEPYNVRRGVEFRLLVDHTFYRKENGGFAKDAKGKRVKAKLANGSVVISSEPGVVFYGTTYKNGYNRPSRANASVKALVRLDERTLQSVLIPLAKLRQHAEPMSDVDLMARSEGLSYEGQFAVAFGCKAWESDNWTLDFLKKSFAKASTPV